MDVNQVSYLKVCIILFAVLLGWSLHFIVPVVIAQAQAQSWATPRDRIPFASETQQVAQDARLARFHRVMAYDLPESFTYAERRFYSEINCRIRNAAAIGREYVIVLWPVREHQVWTECLMSYLEYLGYRLVPRGSTYRSVRIYWE